MCIPTKPTNLLRSYVGKCSSSVFFAAGMENMCACRMCMHVFTLCVCVRKTKERSEKAQRQKAVMIWGEQGDIRWRA